VLNKTQATALAKLTNSDAPDDWLGTRVRLSPAPLANGKQTIVVTAAPSQKTVQSTTIFDDETDDEDTFSEETSTEEEIDF
jgi:hypothetical protein